MKPFIAHLIVVFVCTAPLANAHPHEEPADLAALQKEIDALRAELAALRLKNSQLQKELQAKNENESPNQEEPQEEKNISYRSADEMLKRLPEKLNPSRQGWTLSEMEEVKQWMSDELTGRAFEATRTIRSANVIKTGESWSVLLYLKPTPMRYKSWGMEEKITTIRLSGDAKFAEEAGDRYKPGKKVQVTGIVAKAYWSGVGKKSGNKSRPGEMTITLEHTEVK